jgi:ribosome biogenesis GTPase
VADGRTGLVVALQANYCSVELDQPGPGDCRRLLCTPRSRLSKTGQTICVGDLVQVDGIDWAAARGAVAQRLPRHSLLQRPAVANVSRVVVVVSLAEPALDPDQLTRFLITAEATGQPVLLVLSKADRLPQEAVALWCGRLRRWGYEPLVTSTQCGLGLEQLRAELGRPGIAVLCGPSGVGKSSLLNGLRPDLQLRVAAVSGRLQRGRHTTRHVELFAVAPGALLADTPGFNRPQLPADPAALAPLFPELRQRLGKARCLYADCLHLGEPGCTVGSDWDRHGLYSRCLADLQEEQAGLRRTGSGAIAAARDDGAGLRRRGDRLEPRLAPAWRQPSRRRQRQRLSSPDLADSDHP